MCFGKDCDRREHCYRYMAKPNQVQTYSDLEHDCKIHNYRNQLEFKNTNKRYLRCNNCNAKIHVNLRSICLC